MLIPADVAFPDPGPGPVDCLGLAVTPGRLDRAPSPTWLSPGGNWRSDGACQAVISVRRRC